MKIPSPDPTAAVPAALPAIVLQHGAGVTGASWAWVREYLTAQHAQVLVHDRGLEPSDAASVAASLDAAVTAAGIDRPFLLVGHSLGGIYARHYAATRPGQVVGLVLVDPTPADPEIVPERERKLAWIGLAMLRVFQALAWTGLLRLWHPSAGGLKQLGLPAAAQAELLAAITDPQVIGALIREMKGREQVQRTLLSLAERNPAAATLPTLVFSAGVRERPGRPLPPRLRAYMEAVEREHRTIAARSRQGEHLIIAEADHNTLLTKQPLAEELASHILRFGRSCAIGAG
jgi:pimeloyl-ACP methyl ester carboxylesterase